jgi:hypothetical protein
MLCTTQEGRIPLIGAVKSFTGSLESKVLSSDIPVETINAGEYIFLFSRPGFYVYLPIESIIKHRTAWLLF